MARLKEDNQCNDLLWCQFVHRAVNRFYRPPTMAGTYLEDQNVHSHLSMCTRYTPLLPLHTQKSKHSQSSMEIQGRSLSSAIMCDFLCQLSDLYHSRSAVDSVESSGQCLGIEKEWNRSKTMPSSPLENTGCHR